MLERVPKRLGTDWARRYDRAVADLYSLVHRDFGPISTYTTLAEAEDELAAVREDESDWLPDLGVEPFVLDVSE